jgi:transcriptional regulator with XRE-family HTH domain
MTANQYRAACAKLGITIQESAKALGLSEKQAYRYANSRAPITETVAKLLRCMIRLGTIEV